MSDDDLGGVRDRLRAAYRAVAATTVLDADSPGDPALMDHDVALPPGRRRANRLAVVMATFAVMAAGFVATFVLSDRDRRSSTTQVATQPATTGVGAAQPMCGSQLPRPVDVPEGYRGPARVASSVAGQLVLQWTSDTGSIVARWPADPQFAQLTGLTMAPTPDGQPSVASASATDEVKQTASGNYHQTIVFGVRNVSTECRSIQVDVIDSDRSRVDGGAGRLANRGLFVSTTPLVVASDERAEAPDVVPCNAPPGAVAPPKRGGPVAGSLTHPTPTAALQAFLEADPSLPRNQYLEVRLPDGSVAYAREQPTRPGSFVTVVHVERTGGGWSVDRWESSGC